MLADHRRTPQRRRHAYRRWPARQRTREPAVWFTAGHVDRSFPEGRDFIWWLHRRRCANRALHASDGNRPAERCRTAVLCGNPQVAGVSCWRNTRSWCQRHDPGDDLGWRGAAGAASAAGGAGVDPRPCTERSWRGIQEACGAPSPRHPGESWRMCRARCLARQITATSTLTGTAGAHSAVAALSPDWGSAAFAESLSGPPEERQLAMAPGKLQEFVRKLNEVYERASSGGELPVVLSGGIAIRAHVRAIVERVEPGAPRCCHS